MAFNKQELIAHINNCNMAEHVVVGYGGALVLLGLRETTNDIDCFIEREFFEFIKPDMTTSIATYGDIYTLREFDFGTGGVDVIPYEHCIIEGIRVLSLSGTLEAYRDLYGALGREKDLKTIKAIELMADL